LNITPDIFLCYLTLKDNDSIGSFQPKWSHNITLPVRIAEAPVWKTAFSSFKFAKFLYLGSFLFGYVPGFTLQGDFYDIAKAFDLILIGAYFYAYLLSFVW